MLRPKGKDEPEGGCATQGRHESRGMSRNVARTTMMNSARQNRLLHIEGRGQETSAHACESCAVEQCCWRLLAESVLPHLGAQQKERSQTPPSIL